MTAVVHFFAIVCVVVLAGSGPASAWWQYAEWGLSEGQIRTASSGQAVPCRPDAPVCASTPSGQPRLFVESLKMVGMPASASFVFVGEGRLNQTIVLFPNADFALVCNLLQGIHGQPVDDRPATLLSGSGAIIDGDRPSPPQPRRLDRGYPISGRSPESACCLQPKLHGAFVTRTSLE